MENKFLTAILLLSLLLLFSLILNSCATFDLAGLKAAEKVAVLTIYCDKRLELSGFKGMAVAISALAQNEDFNLQSTVQKLKTKIMVDCEPAFPFTFVEETAIIGKDVYQTLNEGDPFAKLNPLIFAVPTGYKVLSNTASTIERAASGYPDVKAFMFVYVNYVLRKKAELLGFGIAEIQAQISIIVKDRAGDRLLQRFEFAKATETIKFALGGVFDASKIRPLCEEATDIALNNIAQWIQKELNK